MIDTIQESSTPASLVLAIDPGNEQSAFVLFDTGNEVLLDKNILPNEQMREFLKTFIVPGTYLVIEQIASFGMPVGAEVFETVFWSGRFAEAWRQKWSRIKRHEVKMHLCHNMRAKDSNIRQALIDRYGAPGVKKAKGKLYGVSKDLWAALALAVTFGDRLTAREAQP